MYITCFPYSALQQTPPPSVRPNSDFPLQLYSKHPRLTPTPPDANPFAPTTRWATVDGDADRLLYFFAPEGGGADSRVCLLDGDRIAALFATFIADQLRGQSGGQQQQQQLTLGVVQTANANAASTRYFEHQLGAKVVCALTGVKHLHKAAKEFDFGVYFEVRSAEGFLCMCGDRWLAYMWHNGLGAHILTLRSVPRISVGVANCFV